MTNVWKGLRCPYDTGLPYFDRRLCVREECDTMCMWRYDVDGNRPKEVKAIEEVRVDRKLKPYCPVCGRKREVLEMNDGSYGCGECRVGFKVWSEEET